MMPPLGLRLGEPRDLEACAAIYLTAAPMAFPWLPADDIRREQFEAALREEEFWVAERDGTIAGFVSIYLPDRFIHSLYVHPARQRQGIGQRRALHLLFGRGAKRSATGGENHATNFFALAALQRLKDGRVFRIHG